MTIVQKRNDEMVRLLKPEFRSNISGGGFPWDILVFSEGLQPANYPASVAGLTAALLAAANSLVLLPVCQLSGDFTLLGGTELVGLGRYLSRIYGSITGAASAKIVNLSITISSSTAGDLIGVVGPATGTQYVCDCNISVTQNGAGNAYGISADAGGNIESWDSSIIGTAAGAGDGYAAKSSNGVIEIYGGRCHGSTDRFITVIP